MPTFKLPDIGEGVQEGEIVKWNVKEGDQVHKDDIIVEVMTDKVTVQIPSPYEGKVSRIYVKQGEIAKVGSPLIDIGASSGEAARIPTEAASAASQQMEKVAQDEDKVLAPPAVRKLAHEMGIDLAKVKGSGSEGRITLQDVKSYGKQASPEAAPTPEGNILELKGLRRLISEKMSKSKQVIPHYAVAEEVKMDALYSMREKLKELGVTVSYTPFFVKASVLALKEYPYLNARSTEDGKFEILNYYNIGIAIDTPDGLTVAVVKNADKKTITNIYKEIEDLAGRAREGKLRLDEVKDSTFTVTNVGSIGGIFSTPIINYPEVAILGVHRIMDTPSGKSMFITLSADHRLVDGALAARFIVKVKKYLEEPSYMLV
ncbi:MAG: dihydrolipoamide acetyltransferase family protein [Thermoplasmatales archaeon]